MDNITFDSELVGSNMVTVVKYSGNDHPAIAIDKAIREQFGSKQNYVEFINADNAFMRVILQPVHFVNTDIPPEA